MLMPMLKLMPAFAIALTATAAAAQYNAAPQIPLYHPGFQMPTPPIPPQYQPYQDARPWMGQQNWFPQMQQQNQTHCTTSQVGTFWYTNCY